MLDLIEKLKSGGNQKKIVENLVIFLILLVIVMVVINTLFTSDKENEDTVSVVNTKEITSSTDELEVKLENILSKIEGAGKVDVMISYLSGIEQVPMYDLKENLTVTEEKDKEGGQRKTEQKSNEQSIVYEEKNNTRTPVMKQTIMPEIIGVIVVADGANNVTVKNNIINAVEATVNTSSHHIQVFPSDKSK